MNDLMRGFYKNFTIYIIGRNRFQNELVAYYLEKENGFRCSICESIHDACLTPSMMLLDYIGNDLYLMRTGLLPKLRNIVLFNVERDHRIERDFPEWGIQGYFYQSESPQEIGKSLKGIIEGKMLKKLHLAELNPASNLQLQINLNKRLLTRRETEMLFLVVNGISNKDIADELCVSLNTVKTHLYKIYRKIKVSNRLQAALWAQKNMRA